MKNIMRYAIDIFLSPSVGNKTRHLLIISLAVLTAFVVFRTQQSSDSKRLTSAISSILRNESMTANTYAISKVISDIEFLGLVQCAKVREIQGARTFYDSSSNNNCYINTKLSQILTTRIEITSINGASFQVEIQPKVDGSKIFLELIVYIIIILSFRQINKSIQRKNLVTEARIQAIELEKQLMLNHAKQIRHDVASPLTAIMTICKLIPHLDPEISSVLRLAVERTQMLFNELNRPLSTNSKKNIDAPKSLNISQLIEDIIVEKESIWRNSTRITFKSNNIETAFIKSELTSLGRIISNLLNNAYEACENVKNPLILIETKYTSPYLAIEITDNGKGIPPEILPLIGEKGFSIGKENHSTAGSGLGIFSAIQTLKQWSGDLQISSTENKGTTLTILLMSENSLLY